MRDEDLDYMQDGFMGNPLLEGLLGALDQIDALKLHAREYYMEVILTNHPCPACGGRLRMSGPGWCGCDCGLRLDPTVAFQRCPGCGGQLALRYFHYACTACQLVVPSRFLFDERVFNADYYRERMADSRERKKRRLAEIRGWLWATRSQTLPLPGDLLLDSVPGFTAALDEFIGFALPVSLADFVIFDSFRMADYRRAILAGLGECRLFSQIAPVCPDSRRDRARRFTTLIFMWHEREVDLVQYGDDLWVMRHEADPQGC